MTFPHRRRRQRRRPPGAEVWRCDGAVVECARTAGEPDSLTDHGPHSREWAADLARRRGVPLRES